MAALVFISRILAKDRRGGGSRPVPTARSSVLRAAVFIIHFTDGNVAAQAVSSTSSLFN
jgi:hypothetical protein